MAPVRGMHVEPPVEFVFDRKVPPGRYPLAQVFPGLEKVPPFVEYPASPARRRRVLRGAEVEIVRGQVWMYVAPHEVPPFAKAVGWEPVTSRTDCIVVGRGHLSKSPRITVYLDILHELFHVFQRHSGRDLWDLSKGYAGSSTEIEAYGFALKEARRLGASDRYLRKYLEVEWISVKEHALLLRNLGVPSK
ncbi:MAG: hypothetical protein ACLQD8_00195 [Thermoplasmata archaeon]